MKKRVEQILTDAVRRVLHLGGWSGFDDFQAVLERPKQKEHGDYASNLAMILASRLKQNPRKIAELVCKELRNEKGLIKSVEVAGQGFINIRLTDNAWQKALVEIEDPHFARPNLGKGERLLIEYVSANPTGPLHVGNARGGPLGDSLARILSQCGYDVTTEYYVNDIGGQVDRLGASILHWMKIDRGLESELPEGGYYGEYVKELAREAAEYPERDYLNGEEGAAIDQLSVWGVKHLLAEIRGDCEAMGSTFDRWVFEKDLCDDVEGIIDLLNKRGATREAEGALWFVPIDEKRSEPCSREGEAPAPLCGVEGVKPRRGHAPLRGTTRALTEDRESVLRRSNGEPTYFADDIVCHLKRYQEGFDRIINIWGANHHGHVLRLKAALKALDLNPETLEVILYQYVRVCRGTETVKMSKRAGNYVTAREVLDEVGPDAMRFFLLQRAPSAHLDFDLELAKKESAENPIYYIQYAHARICSVRRKATDSGFTEVHFEDIDPTLLDLPEESQLIQFLFEYPEVIEKAAINREPHHIAYYLLGLARLFHNYYSKAKSDARYRVISQDIDTSRAKLYLLSIIKSVLADGLQILNLTAPEEMRHPPPDSDNDDLT